MLSLNSWQSSKWWLLLFSHWAVFYSLPSHEQQHANLPCPSVSPWVCSTSRPLSWWCHPAISSSVIPFSSCPQSFPASASFPTSQLFASGGQTWRFSISISPSNEYSGLISFRIDWFDLLAVQGSLESLLQHHSQEHQFFSTQPSIWSNCHIDTWLLEKP